MTYITQHHTTIQTFAFDQATFYAQKMNRMQEQYYPTLGEVLFEATRWKAHMALYQGCIDLNEEMMMIITQPKQQQHAEHDEQQWATM